MSFDIKKEMEESARARENANIHVREMQKTRVEHKCGAKTRDTLCKDNIHGIIYIGSNAKVVSTVETYNYRDFYKTKYYHIPCFLQTYPNWTPREHESEV